MSGYYGSLCPSLSFMQTGLVPGQRHGRALYVALKCIPAHSTCLLDCEELLATTAVDTSPSLPLMQAEWVRGLHPLSTLFAAFQNLVLTIQTVEPTARQSFKFRDDYSIGRTHSATLEIMKSYVYTARISSIFERCLPTTVAGIRTCSSLHVPGRLTRMYMIRGSVELKLCFYPSAGG